MISIHYRGYLIEVESNPDGWDFSVWRGFELIGFGGFYSNKKFAIEDAKYFVDEEIGAEETE